MPGVLATALALLDQAEREARRLRRPGDPEALHDFRVVLRRLLTHLKAWRVPLEGRLPDKLRRRLRRVFRATSPTRDAEVALDWLEAHERFFLPRDRPGIALLRGRLRRRRRRGYRSTTEETLVRFGKARRKLRPYLKRRAPDVDLASTALGSVLADHAAALLADLDRSRGMASPEAAHRLRIAAKTVRYLLEPLRGERRGLPILLARLKELQDLLGAYHDAAVLEEEALALARRGSRAEKPGLAAAARLLGRERRSLAARLGRGYLGRNRQGLDRLLARAARLPAGVNEPGRSRPRGRGARGARPPPLRPRPRRRRDRPPPS